MPLRDHFHPPFSRRHRWDLFHGGMPMVIATYLNPLLPDNYSAGPTAHMGSVVEVDVATFQGTSEDDWAGAEPTGAGGAAATAAWAPPKPSLTLDADWSAADEYEVKVYDTERSQELVAAIEIVSPSNKDRPEHRNIFATKCAAMLANNVSIIILDFVTERGGNLYADTLELLGRVDSAVSDPPQGIYAVACRRRTSRRKRKLEAWYHPLAVGEPLPTLPLWLTEQLVLPLDLEPLYEQTLKALKMK